MKSLITLSLVAALAGCGFKYSEGTRSGVVQNVTEKGLFCKTWKAELVLEGFRPKGDAGAMSNTMVLHVPTQALVDALLEAEKQGKRVTVKYEQILLLWPCAQESHYTVKTIN